MNITTVTTKGQATFPEEIRFALGIIPGDKILFNKPDPVKKTGQYEVISTKSVVEKLAGSLHSSVPYKPQWKVRIEIGKMLAKELGLKKR